MVYSADVTDLIKCRGEDPELFFPTNTDERDTATAFCQDCPVREWCEKLGEETGSTGVFGGVNMIHGRRSLHCGFYDHGRDIFAAS